MNLLLLLESDRVEGERFRIEGPRARHVREVLGAEPGSSFRAGLLGGPTGTVSVLAMGPDAILLDAALDVPPAPPTGVDVVLAVPRPKMLRRLLPQMAAMGVDSIVLLRTWRVAKPYLTARVLRPEEFKGLLHEGLMQGRSTRMPRVRVEPLFRPYVEDRIAQEFADSLRLVAHPEAEQPLSAQRPHDRRVAVAVGPEGGFLPFEVELLTEAGFLPVSLGPRILRVDTATVALLAQIDLLRSCA